MDETYTEEVNDANAGCGKSGERVLAFAYRDLDLKDFPEDY